MMRCLLLLAWLAACDSLLSDLFARALPGDTISIDPGVYEACNLTLAASNVLVQGTSLPTLRCHLTVTGADNIIDGLQFADGDGGCVLISGPRTIVRNSVFVNCSTKANGGALDARSAVDLVNVTVRRSNALGFGGAVYAASSLRIQDSRFENNTASIGGAIYVASGTTAIHTTLLQNNRAVLRGGGIALVAGALWIGGNTTCAFNTGGSYGGCVFFTGSALNVNGTARFESNAATSAGGAVAVLSAATVLVRGDNVTFLANRVQFGGGMYVARGSTTTLDGSILLQDNRVTSSGGGVYADLTSTLKVVGSVRFVRNTAAFNGGGLLCFGALTLRGDILFLANTAGSQGGGVVLSSATMIIQNTTVFSQNRADAGGGLNAVRTNVVMDGRVSFLNNAASSVGGGAFFSNTAIGFTGSVTLAGNLVFEGNTAALNGGAISVQGVNLTMGKLVTIRHNSAVGGGGLHALNVPALQISDNVTFWANMASESGGGVFLNLTTLTTACCVRFVENTVTGSGGAVYVVGKSSARFVQTSFERNFATQNGGALLGQSQNSIVIRSGWFEDNRAMQSGGAISLNTQSSLVSLQQTIYTRNTAKVGGALAVADSSTAVLNDSQFSFNSASDGGAIAILNSSTVALSSTSILSSSALRGGALFNVGSGLTLTPPVMIASNTAQSDGGAIFTYSSINVQQGPVSISHNSAQGSGGAIFASGASAQIAVHYESALLLENNSASAHGGAVYIEDAAAVTVVNELCQSTCTSRGDAYCDPTCLTRGCNWDNGDCTARFQQPDANNGCDRTVCSLAQQTLGYLTNGCYGPCLVSSCDWSRQLCGSTRAQLAQCPLFDLTVYNALKQSSVVYAVSPQGPARCNNASAQCAAENPPRSASSDAAVGPWSLDATSAWVYVQNTSELEALRGAVTIELWAKLLRGPSTILSSPYVDVNVSGESIDLSFHNAKSNCTETRIQPADASQWTHYAIVLQANNTAAVYVNGDAVYRFSGNCLPNRSFFDTGLSFIGGEVVQIVGITLPGQGYMGESGFSIGRPSSPVLIDEVRLWSGERSQADIRANLRTECARLQAVVCYEFDNTTVVLDRGQGDPSYGYVLRTAAAKCALKDYDTSVGYCVGHKPQLPGANLAYETYAAPELTPGCAANPIQYRGNRALAGGAIYQSGCNNGLDGHGVCFLTGLSANAGAAYVTFEHNSATTAGGAAFTDCDTLLPTCKDMIHAIVGTVGYNERVVFRNNSAMGYGTDAATAPSQLVGPGDGMVRINGAVALTNNVFDYVPGQEPIDFSLALLDGLGTLVAGPSLPFVLTLLLCDDIADCDLTTALKPPSFYTFATDGVSRARQTTLACRGSSVWARFYLAGTSSAYFVRTLRLKCSPCRPGQSRTTVADIWSCVSCLPTQYVVDPNRFACRRCPAGAACNGSALVDATGWELLGDFYRLKACAPGYVVIRDNSSCLSSSLEDCRTGPEMDHCYRCPGSPAPGRYSLEPAIYPGPLVSVDDKSVSEAQCLKCPSGADCQLGGSSVQALPGYWAAQQRRTTLTPTLYKCLPDLCTGDNQCLQGHFGLVCGMCAQNYTHSGSKCVLCDPEPTLQAGRTGGLVALVLGFMVVFYFVSVSPLLAKEIVAPPRWKQSLDELVKSAKPQVSMFVGIVKILLTFYQVTSCFWTAFDVPWPERLDAFFRGSTVAKGDIFTIPTFACLSRDWSRSDRLLFYTVLPPAVAMVLSLPALVVRSTHPRYQTLTAKLYNAVLVFLFVVYPVCSIAVLDIYNCTRIQNVYWLANDLRVACPLFQSGGFLFVWTVICTVLFPFGIPVLMLWGLYHFKVPSLARAKTERAALNAMLSKFQEDHKQAILDATDVDISICALIFSAIDRRTLLGPFFARYGKITKDVFVRVVLEVLAEMRLDYDPAQLSDDAAAVFDHFDTNKDGELGDKEFATLTCALVQAWHEDLTPDQIDALIRHHWGVNLDPEHRSSFVEWLFPSAQPLDARQRLIRHCAFLQQELVLSVGKTSWNETDSASDQEKRAVECVGFLFLSYRVEFWYFELIEQLRKLLMTSIIVVFYPGSLDQLIGGILITFLGLVLCFRMKPFMQPQLSELQATCLAIQGVTLFYGVVLIADSNTSTAPGSTVSEIILFLNVLVGLVPMVQFFILRPTPFGERTLCEKFADVLIDRLGIHRTAPQQMRTRRRSSTAGSDIAFVAPVSSQLAYDDIISGSA